MDLVSYQFPLDIATREKLKIAVVGDRGSGKSALCTAFKTNRYHDIVPEVVPPFHCEISNPGLQADLLVVDTRDDDDHRNTLLAAIRTAHAIIITYDITSEEAWERVKSYWLEMISNDNQVQATCVIVAATKQDLIKSTEEMTKQRQKWAYLLENYELVEGIFVSSARAMFQVEQLFSFASRASMYPRAPLFNYKTHHLTPRAEEAFRRIFYLFDRDFDDYWNDDELNEFKTVFGTDLPREIAKSFNFDDCRTPHGFLKSLPIFFAKGRLDFLWRLLFRFGYTKGRELPLLDWLEKPGLGEIKFPKRVQLNKIALAFLKDVFNRADTDKDNKLTEKDLGKIMSAYPPKFVWQSLNWPDCITMTKTFDGIPAVDMKSWLTMWKMLTALDHVQVYRMLVHLGFKPSQEAPGKSIFEVIKISQKDDDDKRQTIVACVFGAQGIGKTSLLRMMTKKKFKANLPHTQTPFYAARTIGDKTLVLIDVGDEEKKYIRMKEDLMNFCDIVCIVYAEDNDDSFTYISDLVDNFFEFSIDVPIYLISTKADNRNKAVRYQQYFDKLVKKTSMYYGIGGPARTSAKSNVDDDVFEKIIYYAISGVPEKSEYDYSILYKAGLAIFGGLVAAAILWSVTRYNQSYGSDPSPSIRRIKK